MGDQGDLCDGYTKAKLHDNLDGSRGVERG
jgi:hypothetical protein